jgi:hypothetical protein
MPGTKLIAVAIAIVCLIVIGYNVVQLMYKSSTDGWDLDRNVEFMIAELESVWHEGDEDTDGYWEYYETIMSTDERFSETRELDHYTYLTKREGERIGKYAVAYREDNIQNKIIDETNGDDLSLILKNSSIVNKVLIGLFLVVATVAIALTIKDWA